LIPQQLYMRYILNLVTTLCLTICTHKPVFAQVDTSSINETRNYVHFMDSINKLDYVQDKGFITSVVDGVMKADGKVVGGFGINSLLNLKGDTAFRIEYHDNLDVNIYKTYYYRFDKLIYASLELQGARAMRNSIYLKEEFYNDGHLIRTTTRKERSAEKYFDKINFSMYGDGLTFLANFRKENMQQQR